MKPKSKGVASHPSHAGTGRRASPERNLSQVRLTAIDIHALISLLGVLRENLLSYIESSTPPKGHDEGMTDFERRGVAEDRRHLLEVERLTEKLVIMLPAGGTAAKPQPAASRFSSSPEAHESPAKQKKGDRRSVSKGGPE